MEKNSPRPLGAEGEPDPKIWREEGCRFIRYRQTGARQPAWKTPVARSPSAPEDSGKRGAESSVAAVGARVADLIIATQQVRNEHEPAKEDRADGEDFQ